MQSPPLEGGNHVANNTSLDRIAQHPKLRLGDRQLIDRWRSCGIPDRESLLFEQVCDRYRPCRRHQMRPVSIVGSEEVHRCSVCGYIPTRSLAKVDRHLRKLESERLEVQPCR